MSMMSCGQWTSDIATWGERYQGQVHGHFSQDYECLFTAQVKITFDNMTPFWGFCAVPQAFVESLAQLEHTFLIFIVPT